MIGLYIHHTHVAQFRYMRAHAERFSSIDQLYKIQWLPIVLINGMYVEADPSMPGTK